MKELSLHILDIIQNSVVAKANTIAITINEFKDKNLFEIIITDNGVGMNSEQLKNATDPFYTSRNTRKVGLGLPLFKQAIDLCNGSFNLVSDPGKGTELKISAPINHIDRQPLGDLGGVIVHSMISNPDINFKYKHTTTLGAYFFDSEEIKTTLEGISINNSEVIRFVREMIDENIKEINSDL